MGEIPELKGIGPVIAKHLQDVPNGKEFQHILFLFSKLFFNSRFMLNQLMNTKCDDHSQNEIRRRFSKMIYEALLAGIKEVETHETRYVPATNHE